MLFLTGTRGSPIRICVVDPNSRFLPALPLRCANGSFGRNDKIFMGMQGTARTRQDSTVAELARFFPEATPVRIPVELTRRSSTNGSVTAAAFVKESTVIEFGTAREVLFACSTPLEFADILRLRNSDGSLDTEASVVAVQYHPGKTIVAARFVAAVPNWIVKS
jgi:hypothetical protein